MTVGRAALRYGWLVGIVALIVGPALYGSADAGQSEFRVTLIGSGSPVPEADRFGPATLVEAGDQKLLFDAGRGATIRLWQLKIPFNKVSLLFLTHFHSDHTVGIPNLWLTGWLGGLFGRRTTPFRVIGPTGTKELMTNLERAYAADIRIRVADEHYPTEGVKVIADEYAAEGVVYEKDGVRVTAFEVNHGDEIKPAYGYRVDYNGRSVMISGDTRYNENVIKYGTGADILIHEVAAVHPELLKDQQVQRVMAHHTSPQGGGHRMHPRTPETCDLYPLHAARGTANPCRHDRRGHCSNAGDVLRTIGSRRKRGREVTRVPTAKMHFAALDEFRRSSTRSHNNLLIC
jgi:ribonuclease Z